MSLPSRNLSKPGVVVGFITGLVLSYLVQQWGCTAIGHKEPPHDWPKLEISYHKVGFMELQGICGIGGLAVLAVQYFGCAWIHFERNVCKIYYAADDETADLVIEHELDHCAGKDHMGSSTLSDAWTEWKKSKGGAE